MLIGDTYFIDEKINLLDLVKFKKQKTRDKRKQHFRRFDLRIIRKKMPSFNLDFTCRKLDDI